MKKQAVLSLPLPRICSGERLSVALVFFFHNYCLLICLLIHRQETSWLFSKCFTRSNSIQSWNISGNQIKSDESRLHHWRIISCEVPQCCLNLKCVIFDLPLIRFVQLCIKINFLNWLSQSMISVNYSTGIKSWARNHWNCMYLSVYHSSLKYDIVCAISVIEWYYLHECRVSCSPKNWWVSLTVSQLLLRH